MTQARSLTEATAHKLLSSTRRQHLLALLLENGRTDIEELARQVAAREQDTRPQNITEATHRRVTISLVHQHVPLLEDHDVVQYQSERGVVDRLDVIDEVEQQTEQRTNSVLRTLTQD